MLSIHDLTVRRGADLVLQGVGLRVARGTAVAVSGRSGSGKSTLLAAVLGLVPVASGTVLLDGLDMTTAPARRVAEHRRRRVGVVFQHGELLPELSPVENVMVAALLAGAGAREARHRAHDVLERCGVPTARSSVRDLSGGERQRVAVARALVTRPAVVLADEPTGALDGTTRDQVADLLFAVPQHHGCAMLLVTHDTDLCRRADTWVRMVDGRLAPVGHGTGTSTC